MSYSGNASSAGSTPTITPASTPATSCEQHENQDGGKTPRPSKQPAVTRDFHLDTLFNPVWTSGPNVFSFAENGTVVRPERYELEPYPGYHDDRARAEHRDRVIRSRHQTAQPSVSREAKSWKNVAITEQDGTEYDAMVNGAWKLSNMLGEWEKDMFEDYGDGKEYSDRTAKRIAQVHALEYNGNPPPPSGKW